jgi:hypothetical protein
MAENYRIVEINGLAIDPITQKMPVEITAEPHALFGVEHYGLLDDSQIPSGIMRDLEHQLDPHTMIIDGRDVSVDGTKLDTIETGAEVNNLTDQQAQSLTSGIDCNWHTHDNRYFTKAQLSTSGMSMVDWGNITDAPTAFNPTIATTSTLGGVIIGSGVNVSSNGTISVTPYTLPKATQTTLGGVIIGHDINIDVNGVISIDNYEPYMMEPVISGYLLSSSAAGLRHWVPPYSLPPATTSTLGGVVVGTNIGVDANGTISVTNIPWSIISSTPTSIAGYGIVLTFSNITTALGYTPINVNQIGVANGLATLDGSGHLTNSQIPLSLIGALVYQGVWDANTNTPHLVSGVGTKGWYYKVSVAGSTNIDGTTSWDIGDLIIFDGTTWDAVEEVAPAVDSFNGRTGNVVLSSSDVTTALTYTPYNVTNPAGYLTLSTLPIGSTTVQGILEVGGELGVSNGVVSYTLPQATTSTLGGVIVGTGLSVSAGNISIVYAGTGSINSASHSDHTHSNGSNIGGPYELADGNPSADGYLFSSTILGSRSWVAPYSLPAATSFALGGVKIGSNIDVESDGTISVTFPAAYSLPIASSSVLGGIKIGANVSVAGDGTISVAIPYVLPPATTSVLGGVIVGSNISVDVNGVISITGYELALGNPSTNGYLLSSTTSGTRSWVAPYSLPAATSSVLGGVIIGSGINNSSGTISVTPYSLPAATSSVLGGVIIGSGINNSSGTISVTPYSLPAATTSVLGGIIVGTNISVSSGTISVATATTAVLGVVKVGTNITVSSGTISVATATTAVLGVVKVGTNISVASGVISVATATSSVLGLVKPDGTIITISSGAITVATSTTAALGVVKPDGTTITIAAGVISATQYSLPTASTTVLGGVKIDGSTITISGGVISAPYTYTLPSATTVTLGGVIIGSGITLSNDGTISVTPYTLSQATSSILGGVIIGSGINVSNGTISIDNYELALGDPTADGYLLSSTTSGTRSWVAPYSYSLPAATTSTLGGVIVGSNISVSSGTISITAIPWSIVSSTPTTISGYGIVMTSSNVTTALGYTPINVNQIGVANGLATLDSSGHLTNSQIPLSLVGALVYQGVWDASANSPHLTSGVGTKGWYYKVSVTGTTSIDGTSAWGVGDLLIFNGTTWDSVEEVAAEVTSFNTRTGNVVLTSSDITTALTYTPYNVSNPAGYLTLATLPIASSSTFGIVEIGSGIDISGGVISVTPYSLPTASTTVLGGVKVDGSTITISNGVITAPYTYTLPIATSTILGGVKIGANINISSGTISIANYELALGIPSTNGYLLSSTTSGTRSWTVPYSLPVATSSVLGGVIIGSGINLNSGTISVTPYSLPTASTTVLGGVKIDGSTITISSGVISAPYIYTLPQATTSVLGGIIIGSGINVSSGTISVTPYTLPVATSSILGGVKIGSNIAVGGDGTISIANYELVLGNPSTNGYILSSTASGTRSWIAPYSLPTASTTVLGGVKIDGTSVVISSGIISATYTYTLPVATSSTLGGVVVGSGLSVNAGTISVNFPTPYSLSIATSSTLGGVKIGSNINIAGDGTISITPYSLPIATSSVLGGVKIGNNITVGGDGTISVAAPYSLPAATTSALGGIIIGSGLGVTSGGTLSVNFPASYILPVATASVLGGVKIGANVSVTGDGTISVATPYSLPTASTTILGGVKIDGTTVTISSGIISAPYTYTLPQATTSTLGGVIVGTGFSVSFGNISVVYAGTGSANFAAHSDHNHTGIYEPVLGNPGTNGYILSSTTSGTRSWIVPYSLPAATTSTLGGVIVGTNISVSAGTISITAIPWSIITSTPTTISGYGIVLTSSNITTALGYTPINSNLIGAVNGLATLDVTGHLTTAQIPTSLLGGLNYQGIWNASTNSPALASGVGTKGWYYKVSVAGTTSIDGISAWELGDLIIFDGTTWDRVEGGVTDVTSVFGRTGAVTLISSDVTTALGYTPYNVTNPAGYITASTVPIATASVLGGVKIGANVSVAGDGTISVATPYSLPTASTTVLGGVKVDGATITISSGVISAPYTYTLPTATTSTLGGVIVGSGINLASGTISVTPYSLPTASTTVLGGVKVDGATITISSGVISAATYVDALATTSTAGDVIIGTGLSVSSGTISVIYAGTGSANSAAHSDHTHINSSSIGGPYELTLGNPGSNGYVLSSTTSGTRSWVAQSSYTLPQATASVLGGVIVGSNISVANGVISIANYEPALGNPAGNGYVLSSTTGGVRSWVSVATTLQGAYNGGQTVNVSGSNVVWQLPVSKGFVIQDSTGANTMFSIYGNNTSGSFGLAGNQYSSIQVSDVQLDIYSNGTGSSITIRSAGTLTFDDKFTSSAISLSETGVTGLAASFSGHATSIIGAINYMQTEVMSGGVQNGVLQLTNQSSAPTGAAGQIAMINSDLYFYDATRGKWLTPSKTAQCAKNGNSKGYYLRWPDGAPGSGTSGLTFHRIGTIVGAAINTTTTGTPAVGMHAFITLNGSNVATLTFDSTGDALNTTFNVDFNLHDVLGVKMDNGTTDLQNPIASIEYSFRP